MNIVHPTVIERLAPIRVERLSAWLALAWSVNIFYLDPLRTSWALYPLLHLAPGWAWGLFMLIIAILQLGGSFFRVARARIAGALLAFIVWSFLSLQLALVSKFQAIGWSAFLILAWSCSCIVATIYKGDRRA